MASIRGSGRRQPFGVDVNGGFVFSPCYDSMIGSIPRYEWLRNGDYLDLDSSMSLDGGNLMIKKLHPQHEGYYQCKAKNRYGTALSHVTFLQAAGK